ncbi:MAG: preprotein translocase subunit SecG [Clostridiales bacterium]|jgi:preprotein translocase subunit SecG|nr:preprotein translocase subunit SecG [Clostridiales bacterium]
MNMLRVGLTVFHLIIAVILIVVVMMQESKTGGLSQSVSGGSTETFFGRNKGGTFEAIMRKWTSIVAGLFFVTSLFLALMLK